MKSTKQTQELKRKIEGNNFNQELLKKKAYHLLIEFINKNPKEFKKLVKIARAIRNGLRDDYDFVVAITGREGIGKSTLMLILAILIDRTFNLKKQISLLPTTGEIKRIFKSTKSYGAIAIDEAIKILHKQDWYNNLQKTIVQMYATERYQNKVTFLCIPRFTDLNENFRNHRVNCWIDVVDRGYAFVKIPIPVSYFADPWLMDENARKYKGLLKVKGTTKLTLRDMERIEKRNPCYVDVISFPDLPLDLKEIYIMLKINARRLEEEGLAEEVPKDKLRVSLAMLILDKQLEGKTYQIIKEETDLSLSMIKQLLKEGRTIRKQKQKKEGWEAVSLLNSKNLYQKDDTKEL